MTQDATQRGFEADAADDERLRAAILAALAADPIAALCDLRIGVHHKVAHLGGTAPGLEAWAAVERLVGSVAGVRGVVNRVAAPGAPSPARTIHLDLSGAAPPASRTDSRRSSAVRPPV